MRTQSPLPALLARVARATALHPWRTIGAWVFVLLAAVALSGTLGGEPKDDYRLPGSPSQAGTDLLVREFPAYAGTDARVVVHSASGPVSPAVLTSLRARLESVPHVSSVGKPLIGDDGRTALVEVRYDVPVTEFSGSTSVDALREATASTEATGLQVELGGQVPENFSAPSGTAEAVGVVAALIILVLAFGSVVAAGLPLVVALAGLGVGFGGIGLLAAVTKVSTTAPTIATMVGLGVGIDYALLLVTRYVDGLRAGLGRIGAAERAGATAGLSVVFAGTTVVVSLLGLKLAGLATYATFGYATLLVVVAIMLAAVTLVPALCALAGERLRPRRERRGGSVPASLMIARWASMVGRRPLVWAVAATLGLLVLAAPVLDLRTWPQDAGSQPASSTTRQAYDLVASAFGPGANGPLLVAAPGDGVALAAQLRATEGVAAVSPPLRSASGTTSLISVQPATGPQDERTTELLSRLRASLPPTVRITGLTAVFADISERLAERLWVVVAFVVALSLVVLAAVFRSLVLPVKAAVMNLLSVAAAYGVMVAVFQWGWGATLLGLPHAVPVSSWVPILMFAILFGLSMDYEVFLLSRVREDYLATGDAKGSVVRGLSATGRVITSAAAIMVAVFTGFALDPDVTVKMMGVGLAVAILVDATLVRLVLVPATMALLGEWNWYFPGQSRAGAGVPSSRSTSSTSSISPSSSSSPVIVSGAASGRPR